MTPANRFVPYAYARDNAILLVPKTERDAEVWISDATPLAALNEVMRVFPGKVKPIVVEPTKLDRGDLADLRRPERLGAADRRRHRRRVRHHPDDAGGPGRRGPARDRGRRADHPHDQRAADAGGARRRLRHPHRSRSKRIRWCVSASTARCATWCGRSARCTPRSCRASRSWPRSTSPKSACRRTAASRCASAAGRSMCGSRRCPPATASASCCVCWKRICRSSS